MILQGFPAILRFHDFIDYDDSIQNSLFLSDSSMVVSLIWFVAGYIFYEKDRKSNDFENEFGCPRLWKIPLILRTDSCIIGA